MQLFRAFLTDEQGADGIEYGLIVALIFVVIISAVALMATKIVAMWFDISAHVN